MLERKQTKKLPIILSLIAGVAYLTQSIYYALYQLPILDEGAYLFKGYQYALGNYIPFQPYGFWTNKMYLSFYVYGWVQKLFSAGLLAPRLFAVFLGMLTLAGTWLVARRLGNTWLAALAVLAFAVNPTLISIYSWGISQVLVICTLTWVLVFVLGANRPGWQIVIGSILAAIMVFLRENMIFVIPFLVFYLFWQHGRKIGLLSTGVMAILLVLGHMIFWPDILYLWFRQIPNFESIVTESASASTLVSKNALDLTRIHSLATALRVFIIPLLCTLITIVLWPKKDQWKSSAHQKATVFLLMTFTVLLLTHAYASIGKDYCIYCSTNYFAFFGSMGLILFAASFTSLNRSPGTAQKILFAFLFLLLITFIGFSLFEIIGYPLINMLLPRIHDGKFVPGTVHLWQLFENKYGWTEEITRRTIPTVFGFFAGVLALLFVYFGATSKVFARYRERLVTSIGILLMFAFVISPFMNWLPKGTLSNTNIPFFYQSIAQKINPKIPPGSRVYLTGNLSTILLLYLPDARFYPPQVNGSNSFRTNDDSDIDLKAGLWNTDLDNQWRAEADVFIIGIDKIPAWEDEIVNFYLLYDSTKSNKDVFPDLTDVYVFSRNK